MKVPNTQLPPDSLTASKNQRNTALPDGHATIFSPERAHRQVHNDSL